MCMDMAVSLYVHLWKPEERVRLPGVGITDVWELLDTEEGFFARV